MNKPRYRHGDTVKLKAFAVRDGKEYKKKEEVFLTAYYNLIIKLGEIVPDSLGFYNFSFVLGDTLTLDKTYTVKLSN